MLVLRWLFRFVLGTAGLVLVLFGMMMLTFEVLVWVPDSARAFQPLGQVWFQNDPFFFIFQSHSIQLAQVIAERKLQWPELWNPGITTILNWPSWMALLALGAATLPAGLVLLRAIRRRA